MTETSIIATSSLTGFFICVIAVIVLCLCAMGAKRRLLYIFIFTYAGYLSMILGQDAYVEAQGAGVDRLDIAGNQGDRIDLP